MNKTAKIQIRMTFLIIFQAKMKPSPSIEKKY